MKYRKYLVVFISFYSFNSSFSLKNFNDVSVMSGNSCIYFYVQFNIKVSFEETIDNDLTQTEFFSDFRAFSANIFKYFSVIFHLRNFSLALKPATVTRRVTLRRFFL